jgi:glycosyltransferase involved in cell wall biosynthesis
VTAPSAGDQRQAGDRDGATVSARLRGSSGVKDDGMTVGWLADAFRRRVRAAFGARVGLRRLAAGGNGRLFVIAGHLAYPHPVWVWRRVARHLRPTDRLCWLTYWHSDAAYFCAAAREYGRIGFPVDQVWVLGNTREEVAAATAAGFRAAWVHNNCWLSEEVFHPSGVAKRFAAVMVTQPAAYKRPWLAAQVGDLAIVAGRPVAARRSDLAAVPHTAFYTDVSPDQVCRVINQSRVGLILSEDEGGCFASSEYLMCGIPVVSTPSRGGRDVFYDSANSLIAEPTAAAVAHAVAELASRPADAERISRTHRERAATFRMTFVREVLRPTLDEIGAGDAPERVLTSTLRHKMIDWLRPGAAIRLLRRG